MDEKNDQIALRRIDSAKKFRSHIDVAVEHQRMGHSLNVRCHRIACGRRFLPSHDTTLTIARVARVYPSLEGD